MGREESDCAAGLMMSLPMVATAAADQVDMGGILRKLAFQSPGSPAWPGRSADDGGSGGRTQQGTGHWPLDPQTSRPVLRPEIH